MRSKSLILMCCCAGVAACGSDGEQVAGIDSRGTPSAVSVVSKGTISGFGSVIVNGITFDTSNATFTIDGSVGTQSDLAVGQVVVIEGELGEDPTTATASSVDFDDAVEGPIDAIDLAASTLTVLGQTVRIDAATSFDDDIDPAAIDGLNLNDIIEVSGFFLADGTISATRIERRAMAGEFELTGTVSNLGATTFEINGFVVDFSAAMLENFPSGAPEDGQRVEVKGDSLGGAGELIATRVEFKGGDFGDDGDQAEIEGFITRFVSPTDFDVEGVPITTNAQTIYENGSSADLALNRKVEVEGEINATGVIVAAEVEIEIESEIEVESTVEATSSSQLTVLGIAVSIDESTRIEDKSSAGVENFGLADISVGDYVEIRGYEDTGGVTATLLERRDFDGDVAVRGIVESVSDPNFTILGVTIQTNAMTTFEDQSGASITAAEFFAQADGALAEASGTLSGSAIIAEEVELDD